MLKKLLIALLAVLPFNLLAAGTGPLPNVQKLPASGTVALTFDDGPNPTYTPQILAVLKNNNIKATFFVVGTNAKKYPELIKQIHAQGHAIGSHTLTHPMLTKLSGTELQKEIATTSQIVANIIGERPKCLRYPFGASNEQVRNLIRANGMVPVPMGFNSFDYNRPGTQKIIDWVLKNAYSKQVVLMHDGYDRREQTVAALPYIIEGIRKKGLGFSMICA